MITCDRSGQTNRHANGGPWIQRALGEAPARTAGDVGPIRGAATSPVTDQLTRFRGGGASEWGTNANVPSRRPEVNLHDPLELLRRTP